MDNLLDISLAAPFPPPDLMYIVSGTREKAHFAQHGCDLFSALSKACDRPLFEFPSILDFGIGSGRVARMFSGYSGRYCGVDVDGSLIEWVNSALPWVSGVQTKPRELLPYRDAQFDCIISVSVFTHMNEANSLFYLRELRRVAKPCATILLTVHGKRVAERALVESGIEQMLSIPKKSINSAEKNLNDGGFLFVLQNGHLTTDEYQYGISFTSEAYIRRNWSRFFIVEEVLHAAIHDFQDIVRLRPSDGNKPE